MNDCSALLYAVVRRAQLSPAIKSTSARSGAGKKETRCNARYVHDNLFSLTEIRGDCHVCGYAQISSDSVRCVHHDGRLFQVSLCCSSFKNYNPRIWRPHPSNRNKRAFVLPPPPVFLLHDLGIITHALLDHRAHKVGLQWVTRFYSFLICNITTGREYEPCFSCCYVATLRSIYS